MKNLLAKLGHYYVKIYRWLILLFIFFVIYYFYSCRIWFIKDFVAYIQTIFVGLVAFGIPFLWNAYQRILEIKNKSIGDKINNILSKEIYQKANIYFEAYLLLPSSLFILIGLVLSPFLAKSVLLVLIIISALFFINLTRIFSWIESKSYTDINNLLAKDPNNEDLVKVFHELWEKDDTALQKDFLLSPKHVLDIFAEKLSELIDE